METGRPNSRSGTLLRRTSKRCIPALIFCKTDRKKKHAVHGALSTKDSRGKGGINLQADKTISLLKTAEYQKAYIGLLSPLFCYQAPHCQLKLIVL